MNMNSIQQKTAETIASNFADQIGMASQIYRDPASRLAFLLSTTLPGIMGAIGGLAKDGTDPDFAATGDHVTFTCLLVANATTRVGNIDGKGQGFMVEYSIESIVKTLEQFKDMMGRSFEPMMNESLLEVINKVRSETAEAFTGNLGVFRPQ